MFGSKFFRARAAYLLAVSYTIADVTSEAALIEVADDLTRRADEIDGIDPPRKNEGC